MSVRISPFLCSLLLIGAAVRAQETSSQAYAGSAKAQGSELDEIIVTANKREENIDKVGMSITALTGDALKDRGISSLADIAAAVPGLTYAVSTTNTPIYTLRGVGFNESTMGVYPTVTVYLDEVPLSFPVLAVHSAFDLDQIEVLKGPQGTLFGQNSTGGAINYIAAKPTNTLTYGGDVSYGRFNSVEVNGFVSGPISDNLTARVAINGERMDDWQHSYAPGGYSLGQEKYIAARVLLDWTPASDLRVAFNLNGWYDGSDPQAQQFIAFIPQKIAGVPGLTPRYGYTVADYPFAPDNAQAADWSLGAAEPRASKNFVQSSLRVDYDLREGLTLTSLSSANDYWQNQTTDGDGSVLNLFDLPQNNGHVVSFNQELRIANGSQSPSRWVVGATYENSRVQENQIADFSDSTNTVVTPFHIDGSALTMIEKIQNYAVFANEEFDVTPDLTLHGGVRYTRSDNHTSECNYSPDGTVANLFSLLAGVLGGHNVTLTPQSCYSFNSNYLPSEFFGTLDQSNTSWRVGADYKVTDDTLTYVSVSRGFKAGSFPSLGAATLAELSPVTQESLTAYEVGVKSHTANHLLDMKAATFYYQYKNKQVRGKDDDPIFGPLDQLTNVPLSRIVGAESEINVHPIQGLRFGLSATYLESKIERYTGYNVLGETQNFAGDVLPFTPKWSVGFNGDYTQPLSNGGALFVGASVSAHTSDDAAPGAGNITVAGIPSAVTRDDVAHPFVMGGYATVDARLGYDLPDGHWKVTVWGKNIFNKYYVTDVIAFPDGASQFAGMPATFGVTVGCKFN
jgi:iron complex outermembrane recepter protein